MISIETQNATLHDDVAEELVSAVKAKLLQKHGEERQYQIEEDKGNALPEILQRLEKIESEDPGFHFGLSMTTLEQVFYALQMKATGEVTIPRASKMYP